jgi:DNA-binding NarL/FixJ family response regulator
MIRLLIVEDETLFRLGLQTLLTLNPNLTVVGQAVNGHEAIGLVESLRPDLILMDVNLPVLSGVGALKALREQGNHTPIILLSTFDEEDAFLQGMRAGASAFLRKDVSLADLTAAIEAAMRGERTFRPAITQKTNQRLAEMKPVFDSLDLPDPMTKREVEVLRLLASGLSNKEIADALGTGDATIKSHVSSILSKLGVRDRTRAVLRALELGYI